MRISDWSSDVCSSDLSGRTHNASRGILKDSRITGGRGGGTPSGSLHVGCPGRFCKPRHRLVERQHLLPLPAEHAQRDGAFLRLALADDEQRSEEHTSELQSLMRNSYAVFCLKKNNNTEQT